MQFAQVLIDAASLGSLYALCALSIGLLFGIMRLVNFAQGEFITIGGYALIVPSGALVGDLFIGGWPGWLMVPALCGVCILAALLVERVAFRPLRSADASTLLVASFAISFFIQNLILIIYTGRPKAAGIFQSLTQPLELLGLRVPIVQLVTGGVTAALLLGLALFMRKTSMGVRMRAVAEDLRMARLLGVRSNRVIAVAFAICGFLGAVVSILLVTQTGVLDFRMGVLLVVYAFFATVLGGMGSLVGAALGGFIVGVVSVLLQAYLPTEVRPFRDAFLFVVVILILLLRPQGLVAVRAVQERV